MTRTELIMPKMGESIMEATIIKWYKNVGDYVEQDETILEIATDKVDSEIPSPVAGKVVEILFKVDDVIPIGTVIALIEEEGEGLENGLPDIAKIPVSDKPSSPTPEPTGEITINEVQIEEVLEAPLQQAALPTNGANGKFFSPLVKNIAKEENLSINELEAIPGTGLHGRVTKTDILDYISTKGTSQAIKAPEATTPSPVNTPEISKPIEKPMPANGNTEIIEMDRMRRLIADHMVMSKKTAPHVTSFVEADVTNIVKWRDKNKDAYLKVYGEKITFTPIFLEAIAKALKDFPRVNCSVDGNNIIIHKNLNIGMAAALPSGNLIVPVIKNADHYNLSGLTKQVNDLASRARENKLKPDEVQGGTFTMTNVGTFGNVMGTPIINQPQCAILAVGAIKKKPAVLETIDGDVIAIRQLMFMSLSYDHRVIDGSLGGSFLKRISDYLEGFDLNRPI
jgi:2-oxoglutarate dehydrogenase E2 component (dihydrolipoamide succinyltransferase)